MINAMPAVLIDSFSLSSWIEFTLRPVGEIASYEASLNRILGSEYEPVPASSKTLLRIAGLVEVIWIGVWGFAFAKAIRR